MLRRRREQKEVIFEESLGEEWLKDVSVVEVPLGNNPFVYLGAAIFLMLLVYLGRIVQLNYFLGETYSARAEANMNRYDRTPAPRGLIFDREGKPLVENIATFSAWLDAKEFLGNREMRQATLSLVERALGISAGDVWSLVRNTAEEDFAVPIVLDGNLSHEDIVELEGANLPAVRVVADFKRQYAGGRVFSAVVGYTGRVGLADMKRDPALGGDEVIGRAGVEAFYDKTLRGTPGLVRVVRDAKGVALERREEKAAGIGVSVRLAVDADLQRYFYTRLKDGLSALGRSIGVGIAVNPQNGEILALVNIPSFDNTVLGGPGHNEEKREFLTGKDKPLFNRAVSGLYNPGSTIKPLVAVAALRERVIAPEGKIFSPGYLDVPNPYNPDMPSRYLDWRYQGDVDLAAAIAQSSNVYFYTVGGGAGDARGLGITKLREWWQKFNLGAPTGVDLPGEEEGFLPSPEWKEKKTGRPWLLGDTYNVSIGQGDLLVTPLQIILYVAAIANGGKILKPTIYLDAPPGSEVVSDLTSLAPELAAVRKGMRQAVTSPLGTAHLLADVPLEIAAKTGTAQVANNTKVNALFVGYGPSVQPEIAVLVLIENAREGSLNAVPIAKDVFEWYYQNKLKVKS